MFIKLILTNLSRHRVRTIIGVAGISFSVAAMLTVITILQGAIGMFERILSSDSDLVVFERNVSDLFFSSVPDDAVKEMNRWTMVQQANPVFFGMVSSADQPMITCFGVAATDPRITEATWICGNRAEFGADPHGVVLGARAAEFLHAKLGGSVPIGRESFTVGGIVKTANGFEDGGVFMPVELAQNFFHKLNVVSVATVKLKSKADEQNFKNMVAEKYPGLIALENDKFNQSYAQFRILKAIAWAVSFCGLVLGGLGVANTMIMSVFTRIREIAILRVNGFSSGQVAAMILGESALVSIVGAALGLALGVIGIIVLKSLPVTHGYVDAHAQWVVVLAIVALACATGISGALYPAFYGSRIRPVEALRFE